MCPAQGPEMLAIVPASDLRQYRALSARAEADEVKERAAEEWRFSPNWLTDSMTPAWRKLTQRSQSPRRSTKKRPCRQEPRVPTG
jgi:hypothetical protein